MWSGDNHQPPTVTTMGSGASDPPVSRAGAFRRVTRKSHSANGSSYPQCHSAERSDSRNPESAITTVRSLLVVNIFDRPIIALDVISGPCESRWRAPQGDKKESFRGRQQLPAMSFRGALRVALARSAAQAPQLAESRISNHHSTESVSGEHIRQTHHRARCDIWTLRVALARSAG